MALAHPLIAGGSTVLRVADVDRAIRFYTQVLDLTLVRRLSAGAAIVAVGPGLLIELRAGDDAPDPAREPPAVALEVRPPLEEVVAALQRRGVRFRGQVGGATAAPAREAHFADPDGNPLLLRERR